ncbi:hypothetical protein FA13DRAFT_1713667 [Coprinellus micaceus]|uniref:Uncharacterized protein n=1 Tax=Coprinellus micaceus TaxID=71717 RepID=A0A4Y7SVB0_COPMI|nr:hypothetical protein FA13DRAFT_1713667 [Coprinellus micaceus]
MEFNPWLDACSFGQGHGVFTDDASGITLERQSSLKDTNLPRSSVVVGSTQWPADVVSSTTDVWRNDEGGSATYSTLPDSWSQTLDSLLGSTLDGTHTSPLSPRSSPETSSVCTSSGDSTRLFSSATSSASSSGPSHSTSPRPYRLSLSTSDPFDILPSESPKQPSALSVAQRSGTGTGKVSGSAFTYPTSASGSTTTPTSTSLPDSSAQTQTPVSYITSTSGPAFRLLLPGAPPSPPQPLSISSTSSTSSAPQAQVQATCVAPADLALHRLPAPAPKHHTILAGGGGHRSSTAGLVSLSNTSGYYPNPPTMRNVSGGLSGWTPSSLPTPLPGPTVPPSSQAGFGTATESTSRTNYALASAIVPGLKPPCPRPSAGRLSLPSSSNASNRNNSWTSSRASLPNLTASSSSRTHSATASSLAEAEATVAARRTRRRTTRKLRYSLGSDDDDEGENGEDDDDSEDAYQPSTSSSPDIPSRSNSREGSPHPYPYPRFGTAGAVHTTGATGYSGRNGGGRGGGGVMPGERTTTRRGKGKAKGSAALALAVVTQMSRMQQQQQGGHANGSGFGGASSLLHSSNPDLGLGAFDSNTLLYHTGGGGGSVPNDDDAASAAVGLLDGHRGLRKRKNTSIPLPVPVPHLIKKSRGRKVPYVAPGGWMDLSTLFPTSTVGALRALRLPLSLRVPSTRPRPLCTLSLSLLPCPPRPLLPPFVLLVHPPAPAEARERPPPPPRIASLKAGSGRTCAKSPGAASVL